MAITRFQDLPSTNTPINSANLNGNFDELGAKVGTSVDSNYRTNIIKGKNLLNKSTSVNGSFTVNSTSETLDSSGNSITSAWIPCKPNTSYVISGEYNRRRWQTKASDGTITYVGDNLGTITTNSTAKWLRVYYYYDSSSLSPSSKEVQIEEGSTATTYEAYITPAINVNGEDIYVKPLEDNSWVAVANTVYYKRSGNVVCVRGYSANNKTLDANNYTAVATLPEEIRPKIQLGFPWSRIGEGQVGITRINTTGVVELFSSTGTSYWAFTITYII